MIALWAMIACTSSTPPLEPTQPRAFTLAYTNNLDGEIEPCG